MNTVNYNTTTNSIVITIDGKSYVIPMKPNWRGTGQYALLDIASTAFDLHGIWLPTDVRQQILEILNE